VTKKSMDLSVPVQDDETWQLGHWYWNALSTKYHASCFIADPVAMRSEVRTLSARTLDHGFESCVRHGCLSSSLYVVLSCVGRGLVTS
jgi:hypothetical protein